VTAWSEIPGVENGGRKVTYGRSFGVPQTIDPNGIKAHIEHGVLRITLQKSAAAKPRRIPVS
jgi:HSP20 family molecular chaperone IbpA